MATSDPTVTQKPDIDFTQFDNEDDNGPPLGIVKDVTARDVYKLARWILLTIAILFIIIAGIRVGTALLSPGEADENILQAGKDIWGFGSIVLSSTATLILGYYFGTKDT